MMKEGTGSHGLERESDQLDLTELIRGEAYRIDPYPVLAELRRAGPLHDLGGRLAVTSYHDVEAVLKDPTMSTNINGLDGTPNMLLLDPPDHTRIRKVIGARFSRRAVQTLRETVQTMVDRSLDHLEIGRSRRVDLIGAFAFPVPVLVIGDLLGIPEADRAQLVEWSTALGAGIDPPFLQDAASASAARNASRSFAVYFSDLIDERRARPQNDLLSELVSRTDADALTDAELLSNGVFLIASGHESTVNLIGNGLRALHGEPSWWQRTRDDHTVLPSVIEEMLRFDSPLQLTTRTATRKLVIGGQTVEDGTELVPLLGAANRDPAVFDDADTFNPERPNNRAHLAFGGGAHFCLGSHLARFVATVAIGSLLQRFPRLQLTGEASYGPRFALRNILTLQADLDGVSGLERKDNLR